MEAFSDLVSLLRYPAGATLLLTHVHPDGDVLGSTLGLGLALQAAGHPVTLAGPHPVPEIYRFLPGAALVRQWSRASENPSTKDSEGSGGPYALVVMMDCPDPERANGLLEGARGPASRVLNIDHHPDNKRYGDVNWIVPTASATGEMVCDLLIALGLPITPAIATNLYTAIHTDTGSFRYSNTTPKTLRAAADLVACGADPAHVASCLYETRAPGSLKLLGELLQRVEVSPDGRVAWLCLPPGSVPESFVEAEDLVTYPRSLAGVEVSLLLREVGDGRVKVSLRAKGGVNVGRLAARFGGGGHANAAGCAVEGALDQVRSVMLSVLAEAMAPEST